MDESSHGALFLHTTLLSDSKKKNKTDFNTAIQLHICGVVKKNGGECRDIV